MKEFKHPNILSVFGISVHEAKPCIILPLMVNGDLKHYLVRNDKVSLTVKVVLSCYRRHLGLRYVMNSAQLQVIVIQLLFIDVNCY